MTPQQLATCTGCRSLSLASAWLPDIVEAMGRYAIITPRRQAAFLANVGHESGGLRYTAELWGPTVGQMGYEGRLDLGNTEAGDGSFFRGHGLMQVTGRANHAAIRDRLRKRFPDMIVPDFEKVPSQLASGIWAALSAGDYWDSRKLNELADADAFDAICDIINIGHKTQRVGDSNGYHERYMLWRAARLTLGAA